MNLHLGRILPEWSLGALIIAVILAILCSTIMYFTGNLLRRAALNYCAFTHVTCIPSHNNQALSLPVSSNVSQLKFESRSPKERMTKTAWGSRHNERCFQDFLPKNQYDDTTMTTRMKTRIRIATAILAMRLMLRMVNADRKILYCQLPPSCPMHSPPSGCLKALETRLWAGSLADGHGCSTMAQTLKGD